MDDDKPEPESQRLLAKALRGATLGAMSLLLQAMAPGSGTPLQPILDRARARAGEGSDQSPSVEPLVMQAGGAHFVIGGHRSHQSHSSHVSGGGGGSRTYWPEVTPTRTPAPVEIPHPAPVAKKTTLRVKATPRARVFINGKEVGLSPTGPIEIEPGTVEIRLEHKVLGEKLKRIVVNAGDKEELNIDW